jgi:uncharacterized membrane protein
MASNKTLNTFLASAVALTLVGGAGSALADKHAGKEKCYGVVKAGMNDCGSKSGSHACAGMAKEDGSKDEFVVVPAGLCEKLAGGTVGAMTADDMDHSKDKH